MTRPPAGDRVYGRMHMKKKTYGRVTIPTDLDIVPETIDSMKKWGADAIRDCDGTEFPAELAATGAKIYFENSRIPHRAILWAAHAEESLPKWFVI